MSNRADKVVKVDVDTSQLLDVRGRTRFFRGVNVVYKKPPYHPPLDEFNPVDSFAERDVQLLASLNVNCIRLGVQWAGVEPTRGKYDPEYIAAIRRIIQLCGQYGLYVLVEFHQDVLARQFGGHGVPDWFVNRKWLDGRRKWMRFPVPLRFEPVKTDEDNMPDPEQSKGLTWYLMYFSFAVANAYGKLYSNHDGLLDAFAAYWRHVVEEFTNEPNVIGYEIINEPWCGNHWKNPLLLLPGHASRTTLHTLHEQVAKSIRMADPDALVYFEGLTWDIVSQAPHVPGGPQFADRTVLSYHYYRPPQRADVDTVMTRRIKDAKRLGGCGLFMTEWEMWHGDGSEKRLNEMWNTVEAADRHLQNWTGWAYKSFAQGKGSADGSLFDDGSGKRRAVFEEMWSRTFARAVAGKVCSMIFDRKSARFELVFEVDDAIQGPTEIGIVQSIWYPNGFAVDIKPPGCASWRVEDDSTILIDVNGEVNNRARITVVIDRKTEGIMGHG